ncbi:conjugative transposon TraM protein [Algoriphagus ratkowskyi]|uniref:Conjugative transposon TraM protein n=1 Tax=Algoriphagus ratkowskyi TaxID=57028 RepID=A0A2W7QTD6_9BACT|nr:conjugative transposon protein TraM [Algoriphagus ratkowskyi]PZX51504.1 conjugative transposon TraM protein [Algoriphagus ratkowskyi]TXD78787.1 conjugative transposon protein TraM [Algoriphagus ratkowskyi]
MTNTISQKTQQKRKLLMMLPVLTLPFLTLSFWAMGGGSGISSDPTQTQQLGINLELPGVVESKNKELDKLGHYQKSQSDSARFLQQVKNDPYYRMAFNPDPILGDKDPIPDSEIAIYGNTPILDFQDPNEQLVMEKLEALNRTLSEEPKSEVQLSKVDSYSLNQTATSPDLSSDLDRLDLMMQQMQAGNEQADPEMEQMSELLEQILDIQHPERVQARIWEAQNIKQSQAFPVSKASDNRAISSLETTDEMAPTSVNTASSNGFYGLENSDFPNSSANTIKAVVHETQTLMSGATVKLRLTEDASINGLILPKDLLIFGTASLNGERLIIDITHIRVNDQLLPVALAVHDADGMAGIYIPGSISREVATQSGDRAIQGFGISTFDTSLEAQAASAGIETAKSFLGKKIKQVSVTVKAGYQVWLNDENQKNSF